MDVQLVGAGGSLAGVVAVALANGDGDVAAVLGGCGDGERLAAGGAVAVFAGDLVVLVQVKEESPEG